MSKKFTLSYRQIGLGCCLFATLLAHRALAQEELEEVIVTGTYIARPADRPSPVSIMNSAEIRAEQRIELIEVLRDMPQISSAMVVTNDLNPSNSIDLRGLGDRSTLVLLNGQRQTLDANDEGVVDINNLVPSIMVERLELVLDGASALYGSDAVAGVANFITRDDFQGAEFQLSTQMADAQSDVPETSFAGIFGMQGDRTGVVMGLEYHRRGDVLEAEEIRSPERLAMGLQTALYNPGSFFGLVDPNDPSLGGTWRADPLCGDPLVGGNGLNDARNPAGYIRPGPQFCRGSLTFRRTLIPESESLNGMAIVTHDLGDNDTTQLRFEIGFAKAELQRHEGTGLPFLALPSVGAMIPAENPGVIDANQRDPSFPIQDYTRLFSRQNAYIEGPIVQRTEQWTSRAAVGLDGVFGDSNWDWRINTSFSQNDQFVQDVDSIAERVSRGLQGFGGAQCKFSSVTGAANDPNIAPGVGNCQWWNPFASRLIAQPGDPTYNDPALRAWMQWGESPTSESHLYTFESIFTGELFDMPGGAAGFAVGAQYRRQYVEFNPDPIQQDAGFGFAPQEVTQWISDRDTNAMFAELVLYPAESFEIDIAARYEETLNKSSTEPKISMLWQPTDSLYIRASAGSSFRLASPFQSFGNGEGGGTIFPIGGEVTQARGRSIGNPDLEPEESDNWTLGFTWDITDNLTLEATWWDYEFTNLVTVTSALEVLLADIADNGFIDDMVSHPLFPGRPNEVCDPPSLIPGATGRWDGVGPLPDGCMTGFDIQIFNNSFVNQEAVETSGLDLNIDWTRDLSGGGVFGTRLLSTYVDSYKGTDINGVLQERVGTDGFGVFGINNNPEVRANIIVSYARGNHSFRTVTRFTDGREVLNPDPNQANTSESSYTQVDLTYTWEIPRMNFGALTLGVLNVGDREPPLLANGLLTSQVDLYDPRGRMWRLSFDFGL